MNPLKVVGLGGVFLFLSLGSLCAQERPVSVNVSVSSLGIVQAPYEIAQEKGYFRHEGIEPRFVLMQSAVSSKALISRDIGFDTLGSPTINTAVAGLPSRAVFANGDRTNMYLIGAKEIRSLEDLKGKKIGVCGIGDLADVGTKRFLKAKGIDPKEMTFVVLGAGGSGTRMAAVMSGAVAATPLSPPHDFRARQAGFRELGYFGDTSPSFYGGLGTHLEMVRNQPRLVKGFVKASLKGLKFMHINKAETVGIMMRYMNVSREMGEAIYNSSIRAHTKDGLISPENQREIIAIVLEALGRPAGVKPENVFDFTFVREAGRELEAERWKP